VSVGELLTEDPQPLKAVLDFLDGLYAQVYNKVTSSNSEVLGVNKLKQNLQEIAFSSP